MPAKEYNEIKMRGILPSDGMDNLPVTESAPLSSIKIEPKAGMGNLPVTESVPLTSIQVEPKPNATPIPVGKIPDGGTQVVKSNAVINGTVELHQVTAGEVLYLITLCLYVSGAGAGEGLVYMTDDGHVEKYRVLDILCAANSLVSAPLSFPTPLEVFDSYRIKLVSTAAGLMVHGFIFGYEM